MALRETRELRKCVKRSMSPLVVTRYFRAPEIILVERDYGKPIDIWASGVFMANLLQMFVGNAVPQADRMMLFTSKHSWPLENEVPRTAFFDEIKPLDEFPEVPADWKKPTNEDLMYKIIEILGMPSDAQESFITSERAKKYMTENYRIWDPYTLEALFPGSNAESLDLLTKMLQFNPFFRPSVDQCLAHPFFDEIRAERKGMPEEDR